MHALVGNTVPRFLAVFLASVFLLFSGYAIYRQVNQIFRQSDKGLIRGWDPSYYYFWLRSPLFDGDVDFKNDFRDYAVLPTKEIDRALSLKTPTGMVANKYPVGWAVMNLPWMVAGHIITLICNAFGGDLPTDGHSVAYQLMLYLGNVFYGFLAVWICILLLKNYFPPGISMVAVMAVWLSSTLPYYSLVSPFMAHHLTFLLIVVNYYFALRLIPNQEKLANWIMVGISAGLLVITRFQAAVYLLFPVAIVFYTIKSEIIRRLLFLTALSLACFLISLVPQLLAWKALYGKYLLYSYEGEGFNWLQPQIMNILFSGFHGLFFWHSVFLIGLPAAIWFSLNKRKYYYSWIFIILLMIYINASWECWWFGHAFGARAFEGFTLFGMTGFGYLLYRFSRRRNIRLVLIVVSVILVLWNANLLLLSVNPRKSGFKLEKHMSVNEMMEKSREFYFGD